MEKNQFEQVLGAVAVADVVEGRMVLMTSHTFDLDYGSQTDLPGAKVPSTSDEAAIAKFCVAFADDNRQLPIYQPNPSFSSATRYGFEQDANAPFSATVYITRPQAQDAVTIPSGSNVLLYGEGIYTVTSGNFVYDASLVTPGTQLEVAYSGANAGKLQAKSAGTAVAEVVRFYSTEHKLQFRIF